MVARVGTYVTDNSILVLVILAVIAIGGFFLGQGTVVAFAGMVFGGILMWLAGHGAPQDAEEENPA